MGTRVSPTAIGVFVVASLAILVGAIVLVGSGRLFHKPLRFICMFHGDLNGLKVGAPVKVRGVQIGTVADIRLGLSPAEGRLRPEVTDLRLPVVLEIDRSKITSRGGSGRVLLTGGFEDIIRRGMRAQLRTESLLTGLLYVDLDIHANVPPDFALVPDSGLYREIPTVPTQLEALQEQGQKALAKLDQVDVQALVTSMTRAADSINTLASSPSLKTTLDSLKDTTANLDTTINSVRRAVDNLNTKIDPLVSGLHENSSEVNATLAQTRATLVSLQAAIDPDSPLAVHLSEALDQLTNTSRSVGELADYLQRNPSSLVRGRYVSDKAR